jgi:hypothetical protein
MKDLSDKLSDALDAERGVSQEEVRWSQRVDMEWRAAKKRYLVATVMGNAVNDVIVEHEVRLAEEEEGGVENYSVGSKCIDSEERQVSKLGFRPAVDEANYCL